MATILGIATLLGFGLSCFSLGYTLGRDSKASKNKENKAQK